MIAGFGLCLFYLVVSRYYPGLRREVLRHDVAAQSGYGQPGHPEPGQAAMALPNAMESWPTLAHPLANKVGWFNLNNINCGLLGMPLGFLVIYVVSLFTKAPSAEMQAFVDEIRKPRGRHGSRRKGLTATTDRQSSGALRGPASFAASRSRRMPRLARDRTAPTPYSRGHRRRLRADARRSTSP